MPLDPEEQKIILNTIEEIHWIRGHPLTIKIEGFDEEIAAADIPGHDSFFTDIMANLEGFVTGLLDLDT